MFLDDQIVKMVLESKPKDDESEKVLLIKILNLCSARVNENLQKEMNDSNILSSVKQVCNLWDSAARTLEKKGYPYLRIGGFRAHILSKTGLAKILIPMGL